MQPLLSEPPRVPLGEIAEVKAGPSGARLKKLGDHPGGIPVVTPSDFTDDHRVDPRNVRSVPESAEQSLSAYRLEAGDLLVVRQGALGRLAVIGPQQGAWAFGSSCLRVRLCPEAAATPAYLAAHLEQPETLERLRGPAVSSTIPSFNAAALRDLEITLPPLPEQERIVAALADMDEAIAAKLAVVERMRALRPSVFSALLEGGLHE